MRHAANWMILDDHGNSLDAYIVTLTIHSDARSAADIFNNLDYYYLERNPSITPVFKVAIALIVCVCHCVVDD